MARSGRKTVRPAVGRSPVAASAGRRPAAPTQFYSNPLRWNLSENSANAIESRWLTSRISSYTPDKKIRARTEPKKKSARI
jgi:hypothetical protein